MKRVLVGSPIRQKHSILLEFLKGLEEAEKTGFFVSYYFVDDNIDEKSTKLLIEFGKTHDVIIKKGEKLTQLESFCNYFNDEITHTWDNNTIEKVAFFKDTIIEYALENRFDYLFFVDSDIVIDHRMLKHLLSRKVEIVSNVFWTQWQPNWQLEPQCFWIPALSRRDKSPFSQEQINLKDAQQIQRDFFAKMRIPGLYKVDGLGACTLISLSALEKGVRFKKIPNLGILGEDRHFCIRAGVLDIELFYDTVYPAYHIYREEYLDRIEEFKKEGFKYDMCQTFISERKNKKTRLLEIKRILDKTISYVNRKIVSKIYLKKNPPLVYQKSIVNQKIVLQMIVRDINLKYFEEALLNTMKIADYYIIADATHSGLGVKIANKILTGFQYKILNVDDSASNKELFQKMWIVAEQYHPNWIFCLNANEVIQKEAENVIQYLINNTSVDTYYFKSFNIFDTKISQKKEVNEEYNPYLMRYQDKHQFHWNNSRFEKFPDEIMQILYARIDLKVKCYCVKESEKNKHIIKK